MPRSPRSSWWNRSRRVGVVWLWTGVAATAVGLGCRTRPSDCAYDSVERCLWEHGVAKPDSDNPDGSIDNGVAVEGSQLGPLDEALAAIIELMGVGLEWSLVDERARALCVSAPRPAGSRAEASNDEAPPASGEPWFCQPSEELEINGVALTLEAGSGVVALTAVNTNDEQSAEMIEFILTRFDDWCDHDYFDPLEGQTHQNLYRCSLPEGPFLLVGRFPRDLDADSWQVSIAVMDEG